MEKLGNDTSALDDLKTQAKAEAQRLELSRECISIYLIRHGQDSMTPKFNLLRFARTSNWVPDPLWPTKVCKSTHLYLIYLYICFGLKEYKRSLFGFGVKSQCLEFVSSICFLFHLSALHIFDLQKHILHSSLKYFRSLSMKICTRPAWHNKKKHFVQA